MADHTRWNRRFVVRITHVRHLTGPMGVEEDPEGVH